MSSDSFKASLRRWNEADIDKWLAVLRTATDRTSGTESVSRETLVVFCESIDQLNDGLGIINDVKNLWDIPESKALINNIAGGIHEVLHLVSDLAVKLDWPFRGDSVVQHEGHSARSWSDIVLKKCGPFSFWIGSDVIITREHLSGVSYDSYLVEQHLAIEFERELRLWDQRNLAQNAKAEPPEPPEPDGLPAKGKQSKRKRKPARASTLVEAAVRNYHKFDGGKVDNRVPAIVGRDLAKLSRGAFSAWTADRWFVEHFGSKEAYELSCQDGTLGLKLALKGDDMKAFGTVGDMQNIRSDDDDQESDSTDEDDSPKRGSSKRQAIRQKF